MKKRGRCCSSTHRVFSAQALRSCFDRRSTSQLHGLGVVRQRDVTSMYTSTFELWAP